MKVAAIIQARMSSTRLPGKVLLPLEGRTVLARVIERVRACRKVDEVVVATTEAKDDDAIVEECGRIKTTFFRGSLEDVLGRYYGAARACGADVVVRVTSDCPLFDPDVLEAMLETFLSHLPPAWDYLSNTLKRTYPRGLDAEIFTIQALETAHRQAKLPHEREHVTPYIYRHPESFRLHSFASPEDKSMHRWTVDTPEDYQLIKTIYAKLNQAGGVFSTAAVLDLLRQHPDLSQINAHIEQKKLGS